MIAETVAELLGLEKGSYPYTMQNSITPHAHTSTAAVLLFYFLFST
jgi:hypothetical protein